MIFNVFWTAIHLPKDWANDRSAAGAKVPETVIYRKKADIALDRFAVRWAMAFGFGPDV